MHMVSCGKICAFKMAADRNQLNINSNEFMIKHILACQVTKEFTLN